MDFTTYYSLVHGYKPFTWQEEMARYLVANEWHDAIDLPTASGKTSVIDIWFYGLCKCVKSPVRHVPLRLALGVDRKCLVDDAYRQAEKLRQKISQEKELRDFVQPLLDRFEIKEPLVVARLRGGLDRHEKNAWITTPNQPTVITTTVDQYGSRLLFRGYGVSPKMRSIHAGLLSTDILLAIDEVGIARQLRDLSREIFEKHIKTLPGIPKSRVIELSATGDSEDVYKFSKDDLAKRSEANRKVELVTVTKNGTVAEIIECVNKLRGKHKVIAAVCNTVRRAREVFCEINGTKTLMIGRVRPVERQKILKTWEEKVKVGRDREKAEPVVVVCTQVVEVGINFDFDGMVSESAPLDCLTQRVGRVNRLGDYPDAEIIIVHPNEDDPVYGDRSEKTFKWLVEQSSKKVIKNFSTIAKDKSLYADTNMTPRLTAQMIGILAHTFPSVDIDINGYLHGVTSTPQNEVSVVWRREITEEMLSRDPCTAQRWIDLMPPRNHEIVTVPLSAFYSEEFGDIEYQTADNKGRLTKPCVVFRNGKASVRQIRQARTGDVVILPCDAGKYDNYGWNLGSNAPVRDVYHRCGKSGGILCLHPIRIPDFLGDEVLEDFKLIDTEVKRLLNVCHGEIYKLLAMAADKQNFGYVPEVTPDKQGVVLRIYQRHKKGKRQDLFDHMNLVGDYAARYARAVGLPKDYVDILRFAGEHHDLGKADPRFQQMLYFPDPPDPGKLLAKSAHSHKKVFITEFGAPQGWRHELQSLEMLKEEANLLVRHLVASHHGWFRNGRHLCTDENFTPFKCGDYEALKPYSDCCNQSHTLNLFWKLNEKYSVWTVAFLESLLRLADGEASKDGDK